jgi:lysophospholipase L1-like esterase
VAAGLTAAAVALGAFLVATHVTHKSRSLQSVISSQSRSHVHPSAPISSPVGQAATYARVHDVLFIGASYTAGLGATPPTAGYAYLIGRQPGWRAQVDGVSGSGFLNPGPHGGQTFADRVATLPLSPRPDLVVFQGGRNDVGYPMPRLRAAIISTVDLARHRFTDAQIVLLGPIPGHVPATRGQLAVASVMRSAADACHATFIDPIAAHWITAQNEQAYSGQIPAHPGNRGYAYIAGRLFVSLTAIVAERHSS